jgi:protein KTI12
MPFHHSTLKQCNCHHVQGYRYELWCVARAAGTRYVMVHVATPTHTCSEWNAARPDGQRYSDAV